MSEHKTQGAFLKVLISHAGSTDCRELQGRLGKAEREVNCIRRAMFLMAVLLLLSLCGLGYCAVLQPEVFRSGGSFLVTSLLVLVLGSLLSQGSFLGCLVWHCIGMSRLHKECRRLILTRIEPRLKESSAPPPTANVDEAFAGAGVSLPAAPTERLPHGRLAPESLGHPA